MTNLKKADTDLDDSALNGDVPVKLAYPIKIDGQLTSEITMRRPKVRDYVTSNNAAKGKDGKTDDLKAEIILFSKLSGIPFDDIKNMDFLDFKKLQQIYSDMVVFEGNPTAEM